MANNKIAKSTFDGMDTDSKLSVLFDLLQSKKSIDRLFGVLGGIIGGFLAIIGMNLM